MEFQVRSIYALMLLSKGMANERIVVAEGGWGVEYRAAESILQKNVEWIFQLIVAVDDDLFCVVR